jgi:hypothetical protein
MADAWPESGQDEPISISESDIPAVEDPGVLACCSDPQPDRIDKIKSATQNVERKKTDPLGSIEVSFR